MEPVKDCRMMCQDEVSIFLKALFLPTNINVGEFFSKNKLVEINSVNFSCTKIFTLYNEHVVLLKSYFPCQSDNVNDNGNECRFIEALCKAWYRYFYIFGNVLVYYMFKRKQYICIVNLSYSKKLICTHALNV